MKSTSPTEAARQRCHAYLMGELSQTETLAFENELADPTIAKAIELESRLLCELIEHSEELSSTDFASTASQHRQVRQREARPVALLGCVLAVAAALMIAVFYGQSNSMSNRVYRQTVDLAVTKSLLQPAIDWDSPDDDWAQDVSFDQGAEKVGPSDESIAWMVAAVEVSLQHPE